MAKTKYIFNKKTLSYEKIELTLKDRMKKVGGWFLYTLLIVLLSIKIYPYYIDSPKEVQLKESIKSLKLNLDQMTDEVGFLAERLTELQKRDDDVYRTIFEANPIPPSVRSAGYGGINRYKHITGFEHADQVKTLRKDIDQLSKQIVIQSKSLDELQQLAKDKVNMMTHIPGIQPISNSDLKRVASGFGMRLHPIHKIRKMHAGLDFSAPTGSEIYATGDGKVVKVRYHRNGYGKHVIVDHGYGYKTLYAHMSKYKVRVGQRVKRGDVLGYVGNTGSSTSPHLHYEVIKDGRKVNPVSYFYNDLTPEEYDEMIRISSRRNQSFD